MVKGEQRTDGTFSDILTADYTCINRIEAHGSPLELRPCRSVRLG
jgi:hypothetical protein